MDKPKPEQFRKMMALFQKSGLMGRRHAFAWDFSDGRTESTKDLSHKEVQNIISALEDHFKDLDKADVMRKKMIALARQMHWEVDGKADMKRIDDFCKKNGPYKKSLNSHNIKELGILLGVFKKVYKQYMSNI